MTLLLFVLMAGPLRANAEDEQTSPEYSVGESWVYSYEQPDGSKRRRRAEIIAIDSRQRITLGWGPPGKVGLEETRSWAMNEIDLEGKEILRVRHPFVVGKSWTSTWKWRNPEGGDGESTVTWEVIAQERISVGPRELDSFHVEGSGYWKGYWVDPFGSAGRMIESYWYAPAAKSIVKFEAKSFHYTAGHRNTTYELRYELLDFHIK